MVIDGDGIGAGVIDNSTTEGTVEDFLSFMAVHQRMMQLPITIAVQKYGEALAVARGWGRNPG